MMFWFLLYSFSCLIELTVQENKGTSLEEGESLYADDYLESKLGYYRLYLSQNCELIGYEVSSGDIFWSTETGGDYSNITVRLLMQSDDNLVIYCEGYGALWSTGRQGGGHVGTYVTIQDDRNIVKYDGNNNILWQTNTATPRSQFIDVNVSGNWWDSEIRCLNSYGSHLATIDNSWELFNFVVACNSISKNGTCWTGYNNYYNNNNEWFWLSYGEFNLDAHLLFNNISGLNMTSSSSSNINGCVVYNSTSEMFLIVDCDDESLNYITICDSYESVDEIVNASTRYVTLPMEMNWFDGQSFCSRMYGTNLGSIRMIEDNNMFSILSNDLSSDNSSDSFNTYWIGYYNFGYDSESLFDFHRTDFLGEISFGYYANWDEEQDNNEDCVYFNSFTATWFRDNCGNDNSHYIMCDNPYFFNSGYISSSSNTIWNSERYRLAPVIRKNRYTNIENDNSFSLSYVASNMEQLFSEAQISCLLFYNTHLATVYDNTENNLIFSIISGESDGYTFMDLDRISNVLIGYYDFGQVEGSFRWDNPHISSSNNNYANWDNNKPDDSGTNGEDIAVLTNSGNGDWDDFYRYTQLGFAVCDSPYYSNNNDDIFIERDISYVSIHTCESWNNILNLNLANTMHMIIGDFSGKLSDYIIINNNRGLPNPGYWDTYEINDTSLFSMYNNGYDIYKISIGMSSIDVDICIDGLILYLNGESFVLNNQVSNGLILSTNCRLPFFYMQDSDSLIHCNEGLFTIYPSYKSTIINQMINVEISTCSTDDASINFQNVEDDLTINLIGKDSDSNIWVSSDTLSLNHVSMTGNVDWSKIGTLMVSDVEINANGIQTVVPVNNNGLLLGLKLVVSQEDENWGKSNIFNFYDWQLQIDNCFDDYDCNSYDTMFVHHYSVNEMNTTWISIRMAKDDSIFQVSYDGYISLILHQIVNAQNILGTSGTVKVNIYGIFDENLSNYVLPYQYIGISGLNWWEAEEYCLNNYNTHLASIHSLDDDIALSIITKGYKSWIGISNNDNTGILSSGWSDFTNIDDYENWDSSISNNNNNYDICAFKQWSEYQNLIPTWSSSSCNLIDENRYFVCNARIWDSNTNKKFNIPVSSTFSSSDDVVMVAISNHNNEDSICINSIIVNGISAQSIPNRWIGDNINSLECINNDCVTTTYAIMKWPVCSIEITSLTLDWNNANILESESSMSGLTCTNYNRLRSTTCDISNEYSFETSTTFEFNQEQTYSYSTSTSSTTGNSLSTESSDTFGGSFSSTFGTSFTVGSSVTSGTTLTTEGGADIGGISAKTSIAQSFSATVSSEASASAESTSEDTWERTNTDISERYSEFTNEETTSSDSTSGETFGVTNSRTDSISCVGSMDIPPSSKISYGLTFSLIAAIVPTYTDLKLTMCSAYLNSDDDSDDTDDDNSVLYIYDIEGEVGIDFSSHCDVSFNAPTFLNNELICSDEQKLSFLTESTFVPVCNNTYPQFYDGCQCSGLNFWGSPTSCMCVDLYGNPLSNGKMLIHENNDWRDTCRQLNCQNSIYNSSQLVSISSDSTTPAPNSGGALSSDNDNDSDNDNSKKTKVDIEIVVIFLLLIIIFFIILCAFCIFCSIKNGYIDLDKIKFKQEEEKDKNTVMMETILYDNKNNNINNSVGV